jgi:hypothetical protein
MNTRAHTSHESSLPMVAKTLLLLFPLMLTTPSKAFGYADPGTGAFVYQAAYAAFLGGSFYLRKLLDRFWQRRKQLSPNLSPADKRM